MAQAVVGSLYYDTRLQIGNLKKDLEEVDNKFKASSDKINSTFNKSFNTALRNVMGSVKEVSTSMQAALQNVASEAGGLPQEFGKISAYFDKYGEGISQSFVGIVEEGTASLEELQKILAANFAEAGVEWRLAEKTADEYIKTLQSADKETLKAIDKGHAQALKDATKEADTARKAINQKMQSVIKQVQADAKNSLKTLKDQAVGTAKAISLAIGAIGSSLAVFGKMALSTSMNMQTAQLQTNRIFGTSAKAMKDFTKSAGDALGISESAAVQMSTIYGNLLSGFVEGKGELAKATQSLIQQSAVIASATGRSIDDVMDRIRSGLLGNTEAVEDLGINVNIAMIQSTDAFRRFAGDKSWQQLDFQTQQSIRLFSILEQSIQKYGTTVTQGAALDNAKFAASFDNMKLAVGDSLLPIYQTIIPEVTKAFKSFADEVKKPELQKSIQDLGTNVGTLAAQALKLSLEALPKVVNGLKWILDNGDKIAVTIGTIFVVSKVVSFTTEVITLTKALKDLMAAQAISKLISKGGIAGIVLGAGAIGVLALTKHYQAYGKMMEDVTDKEFIALSRNVSARKEQIKQLKEIIHTGVATEDQIEQYRVRTEEEIRYQNALVKRIKVLNETESARKTADGISNTPTEYGSEITKKAPIVPIDKEALEDAKRYLESLQSMEDAIAKFGMSKSQTLVFDRDKELANLQSFYDQGLIAAEEYAQKKNTIEEFYGQQLTEDMLAANKSLEDQKLENQKNTLEMWKEVLLTEEERKIDALWMEYEEKVAIAEQLMTDEEERLEYIAELNLQYKEKEKKIEDDANKASKEFFDMQKIRTDILKEGINGLGTGVKNFIGALQSGESVVKAFGNLVKDTMATAIESFGQGLLAQAAAAVASFNPKEMAKAAPMIAAGMAAIAAAQVLKSVQFADGGVVPGTSYYGDKVPALLNSGEVVVNRDQQANLLFSLSQLRMKGATSGQANINVVVNNNAAGVDISSAYDPDSNTLEIMAERLISNVMSSRTGQDVMRTVYGLKSKPLRTT